ncbi:DeoR/GlpR family transcriptional regulator of sugar metabolism [Bacillus pakistanensis]|uniref:DeoR/GlpR family transcriptional regulator of sugar metabolism n=1 Tax=Rossellomorea pakistanensis TaxID=992288 RepID=A0ABS2NHF0_9BACI|nr:DeoR family transcriptional regulator [Bacillus pakistanensis]MBM7587249.1 DeoR/GlpR family transcriptional regulator of sugar metabolism [Bacillus pakistanensis]
MLPIERQQQILTWLEQEESLRVSDISKRLEVSEMTIYRDLKPLIDQQKIEKTSNGITLLTQSSFSSSHCPYCFKDSNTRMPVQLIKKNQQVEQACCPHCGLLRFQDIKNEVSQIICHDFLHATTISAKTAVFLLNADIHLNCCQPQVIAFESMRQAKQFQMGFGGNIHYFEEAIQAIALEMHGNGGCHSGK